VNLVSFDTSRLISPAKEITAMEISSLDDKPFLFAMPSISDMEEEYISEFNFIHLDNFSSM